jgi:hypothetical protein
MLVFERALLPTFGLDGLRVAMGSAVGLDGVGFGWVTWLVLLVACCLRPIFPGRLHLVGPRCLGNHRCWLEIYWLVLLGASVVGM